MTFRLAFAAAAVFLAAGCDRATPTELPPTGGEYSFSMNLENAAGEATLLRYACYLDGAPVAPEQALASPQVAVTASGSVPTITTGMHTFSVRILDQTVSPSTYRLTKVTAAYVLTDNGIQTTPWLFTGPPNTLHTVRSGESIDWTFRGP